MLATRRSIFALLMRVIHRRHRFFPAPHATIGITSQGAAARNRVSTDTVCRMRSSPMPPACQYLTWRRSFASPRPIQSP
jgi:hypothetical protein